MAANIAGESLGRFIKEAAGSKVARGAGWSSAEPRPVSAATRGARQGGARSRKDSLAGQRSKDGARHDAVWGLLLTQLASPYFRRHTTRCGAQFVPEIPSWALV